MRTSSSRAYALVAAAAGDVVLVAVAAVARTAATRKWSGCKVQGAGFMV
jgi:hypothetical protein